MVPLQILPELEHPVIPEKNLQTYAEIWNSAKRKIVLVGVNQPDSVEKEFLEQLARNGGFEEDQVFPANLPAKTALAYRREEGI